MVEWRRDGNRVRGDSESSGEHTAERRKVRGQGRDEWEQGSGGMALSKSFFLSLFSPVK